MGKEPLTKYLTVRNIFGALISCIIILSGAVITLSQSHIEGMISKAIKGVNCASAEELNKKLDIGRYDADEERRKTALESLKTEMSDIKCNQAEMKKDIRTLIKILVPHPTSVATTVPPSRDK